MKGAPVVLGIASFAVILVIWETVVRLSWVNPFFVSQPSAIAASLSRAARSGELGHNFAVSFREFVIGYGLSVVVGILAGAFAARFRTVEYALDPFLWVLYSAPLIAFYPIFVLWFGLGVPTVIAMSFLLSVTQIATSTLKGIQSVNPGLLRAARSFGATERGSLVEGCLAGFGPHDDCRPSAGHRPRVDGCCRGGTLRRHRGARLQHLVLRRIVENHRHDRFLGSHRCSRRSVHRGIERSRKPVRLMEDIVKFVLC